MRSFLGIGFDKRFKNEISALQSKLRSDAKSGRWKCVDNFHLTLKFLDEIDENTATKICDALKELCSNKHSFKLNISEQYDNEALQAHQESFQKMMRKETYSPE